MSVQAASTSVSRSQTKLWFFAAFFAATVFAVYDKNARVFDPSSPIARHLAPAGWYLVVHAFFGSIALAVAAFQFSNRLRARYLFVHRILGYVYVSSVFIAAPFAFVVALKIPKSTSLIAANGMQAFGWFLTTAIALYCIKNGNVVQHRRWMIRSYPFAMVFTATRIVHALLPAARFDAIGLEAVLWTCNGLAGFLPNVFLDWPRKVPHRVDKATAVRQSA